MTKSSGINYFGALFFYFLWLSVIPVCGCDKKPKKDKKLTLIMFKNAGILNSGLTESVYIYVFNTELWFLQVKKPYRLNLIRA